MEVTDTHCHLDFDSYDNDRDEALERAREARLVRILDPGIDLESSRAAIRLSERYPDVYAAVGIHPNEARGYSKESIIELRSLAQHPKVVAIGEIGLDYYRERAPVDLQKTLFREQLNLAAEINLPVIIHNRDATDDILNILDYWINELRSNSTPLAFRPGVLHSFSGNALDAYRSVELGLKIGITGPVTFRNSRLLHEVVSQIDLDNLLIETDAPFLTPHPFRGRRNEPANVIFVAQAIGHIKDVSIDDVADKTTKNALELFHW